MAGAIFVAADHADPLTGDPDVDSLAAAWLRAGLELESEDFAQAFA